MADSSNDPFALWRKMIGEMEKGFTAFANQAMASPQFSKPANQTSANQAGGATTGAQKQLSNVMERYFLAMNMPSRSQMVDMAERLQSIENQLNDIRALLQQMNAVSNMSREGVAAKPKPPRTKRPPQSDEEPKQPPGEQK
jgi:hypothetical protein